METSACKRLSLDKTDILTYNWKEWIITAFWLRVCFFCLDFEPRANENNCFCADLEHANASLFALKCTGDVVYINRKYS